MDPREFSRRSDACLENVLRWAETFDPDELDYETADGVVTLEFADGTKFVLNRQAGNHQMWFAAVMRAYHYDWDAENEAWRDARDGHRLYDKIAEAVAAKLGRTVEPIDRSL